MPEFDAYMKDAFSTLLVTHGEDENVVYRFRSGATRSIRAIVNRNPPQTMTEAGEIVTPRLTVSLHHHATLGVLHTEIDAGDRIDVAVKKGAALETRLVQRVQDPDSGTITVEVV